MVKLGGEEKSKTKMQEHQTKLLIVTGFAVVWVLV
jgi:hypothetical protein